MARKNCERLLASRAGSRTNSFEGRDGSKGFATGCYRVATGQQGCSSRDGSKGPLKRDLLQGCYMVTGL